MGPNPNVRAEILTLGALRRKQKLLGYSTLRRKQSDKSL